MRPVQVPTWIDHALGLLAYVYLGAAVLFAATGTAWIICRYDPFVGLFRLSPAPRCWPSARDSWPSGCSSAGPTAAGSVPTGRSWRCLSRVSWRHLRIPPEQCVQCRLVRGRLPLRRHPAADRGAFARRAGGGPAAVDRRARRGADPDCRRGALGLRHAIVAGQPASDRPACRADPARSSPARRRRPRNRCQRGISRTGESVGVALRQGGRRSWRNSPGAERSSAAGWGWSSPSNWCSFPFAAAAPITSPTAAPAYPADVASGIAPRSTRGRSYRSRSQQQRPDQI